ncbi:two pore domain potassium channel family protein [Vibrio alginolyticus]|nr:two pore domain potassium channel family protein [Vibrio alginolyticus]EJN3802315.1 two pore domain potassium channel family protein [Vibrio alginolyticus]ELA7570954.1 two pore domain potassium channel family protein [Vibrio alginolyticus]ELA9460377.1 two pore domain potassium channel family protein [Vibrio alginolyticus]ELB2755769.1 two pore domain potassium channel family protein [Vibrio alginolyticus]
MTDRILSSHRKAQATLIKKLSKTLITMIVGFAVAYYMLGLENSDIQHGIYLNSKVAQFHEALYFSVVTITTLGYGDFTPMGLSRLLAVIEAVAGLLFAGYSISQVLSVKQDASIEYILKSQIIQNYTGLLENVRDAKEAVSDYHRINLKTKAIDNTTLDLYHGHPLYSSVIALQKLNGYTQHIDQIGMLHEIEDYLNRGATRVEELTSMIRKYTNYMNDIDKSWKTSQSKKAIKEITKSLEIHLNYISYTKYDEINYKGQAKYDVVINKTISDLKQAIA